jgi:pimeloyl-ACP methyl ester carboxylesterase
MKKDLGLGLTLASVAALIGSLKGVAWLVKKFTFQPSKDNLHLLSDDFMIPVKDNEHVSAKWYNREHGKDIMIYVHGNAGNIAERSKFLERHAKACKVRLLAFDYRGFGKSSSLKRITEATTVQDLKAVHTWANGVDIDARKIFWGESIGCAVIASYLAGYCPVTFFPFKVVLAAPFITLKDVVYHLVPFPFSGLVASSVEEFNTQKNIEKMAQKSTHVPFLILHCLDDTIVPFFHGKSVSVHLQKNRFDAELIECEGGHNDMGFPMEKVQSFLTK